MPATPPIVLIHGLWITSQAWERWAMAHLNNPVREVVE
jgi:pimeloyl-ACP methyl ester carboxylesterase